MNDSFYPITQPFSAGYELVHNADVHLYDDEEAIMDYSMFDALAKRFGEDFIGYVGGLHYQFKREKAVPSGAVAVPADNHDDPDTLLIQR